MIIHCLKCLNEISTDKFYTTIVVLHKEEIGTACDFDAYYYYHVDCFKQVSGVSTSKAWDLLTNGKWTKITPKAWEDFVGKKLTPSRCANCI